ncbi:hypothetical protein T01_14924 [Trichinella spiralis]|uniref:Uncharacterized protein n=1 Tax=Trichinella spiralis TaxID=6334 RepID=A0A0V0YZ90_TRISP|nr:hypothetical protein T01_14924 [Trichinella spiralis]
MCGESLRGTTLHFRSSLSCVVNPCEGQHCASGSPGSSNCNQMLLLEY